MISLAGPAALTNSNGILVTLPFRILQSAERGQTVISVVDARRYDSHYQSEALNASKQGVLTITCIDPEDMDTDDDGIQDQDEDKNNNGLWDSGETDACNVDTDGDGDGDGDGLQDGTELGYTESDVVGEFTDLSVFVPDQDPTSVTDPLNADTDGDGISDGREDHNFNGRVDSGETDPNLGISWLPAILQLLLEEFGVPGSSTAR